MGVTFILQSKFIRFTTNFIHGDVNKFKKLLSTVLMNKKRIKNLNFCQTRIPNTTTNSNLKRIIIGWKVLNI